MAETETNPGTTVKKTTSEESKGVELYNRDGRSKTVTDPAVQVQLEFDGWSAKRPKKTTRK